VYSTGPELLYCQCLYGIDLGSLVECPHEEARPGVSFHADGRLSGSDLRLAYGD
jgi:hypothetical protein